MKRLTQIALIGVVLLAGLSIAAAQQTPQPVMRLGNYIEVANDVFMHIIATADIRYNVTHNWDFENRVRDRAPDRSPTSAASHDGATDLTRAEVRFGVDVRYQKNLTMQVFFEQQTVFDGNLIDDRHNTTNPGGTDVFGRGASTENNGLHVERYWIDYKFPGTPLRMRVGADLWALDQARLVADDDPRFALSANFGNLDLTAAAVIKRESQRIGLQNDNDLYYYTFGSAYTLKPHRFQLDVVYYRDRFTGADTQAVGKRSGLGFTGQKHDSVLLMGSWSGRLGPVRGLLQGSLMTGTAQGGTAGRPAGVPAGRDYDILAGSVVAMVEADLGLVRPFVGFIYGTGDGDPTDDELHGFMTTPIANITLLSGGPFFSQFDVSQSLAGRDFSCPGGLQGLAARPNTLNQGTTVFAGSASAAFAECGHTVSNPFNDRIGSRSHLGLDSTYSNPGVLAIPVGLKVFPLKGHEITGWYIYRAMVTTALVETAFAPELAGRSMSKTQYHVVGGYWMWTLNPHFDIRLWGTIGIPGEGYKDLGRLADCNLQVAGVQPCEANDVALVGGARFRARF